MNQTELLTRNALEKLVDREVTVSFEGAEISVCTLPTNPNHGDHCLTKKNYLEPFSYNGVLKKIDDTYHVSGGDGRKGAFFFVPVVPAEEGKEPYHFSIGADGGRFAYSIERT